MNRFRISLPHYNCQLRSDYAVWDEKEKRYVAQYIEKPGFHGSVCKPVTVIANTTRADLVVARKCPEKQMTVQERAMVQGLEAKFQAQQPDSLVAGYMKKWAKRNARPTTDSESDLHL
ncbi:hypothetical protein HN592_02835 [Candidatus Woesearchaeota archaeon]|jgi:hypothetical protein|nr:hypothetical protein [Candidatus Woesearchaeota archaeon]MBT4368148.1 hypothetical protein [Candidatus Woesearchaeota archaeon]MBT4712636.1 hypothetical protein [Candidatus Woesearchaeota archaeon]MBT6639549.1 hypothetical protein [Candidatus Woesearchaeota archaeon]MBT7133721.1 hypothetical protein [Candidatus Woesearchaeota archaeon]